MNDTQTQNQPDTSRLSPSSLGLQEAPAELSGDSDFRGIIDSTVALPHDVLLRLSRRLAAALTERGVSSSDRIAVALSNSWEWFVVNAAVRYVGAAQIAMNWRLTPSEQEYILRDSQASAVIAEHVDDDRLRAFRSVGSLSVFAKRSDVSGMTLLHSVLADDSFSTDQYDLDVPARTAMIVYTSGTTGKPKGAYRPVVPPTDEVIEYLRHTQFSPAASNGSPRRSLLNMPLHHAAGFRQAEAVVTDSGTAVVQPRFDAEDMLRAIHNYGITDWGGVPTMLSRILSLPDETLERYETSSLRKVTVGAAPVSPQLAERFGRQFGSGLLHQRYGSTETSLIAGLSPDDPSSKADSVGRPFTNVSVRIRDHTGHDLPVGEVGEIWARTPLVIDGYLNRGPLPSSLLDYEGRFRTGDLGRLDADGYLYVSGRSTDLIISGGTNIYPAEIEAVLREIIGSDEVAVIGLPHEELGEIPVAVAADPTGSVDLDELEVRCARELASYKCPRKYLRTAAFPRNHMGKLIKDELRQQILREVEDNT